MSGTSLDGIDIAVIQTDGETIEALGPAKTYAFDAVVRDLLRRALLHAPTFYEGKGRGARDPLLREAEAALSHAYLTALTSFHDETGTERGDVYGFHGQTILHDPAAGKTVQLGDAQALADALGARVVFDFRAADMALGGEGAPLAPVYHRAMAANADDHPIAILNIGGVANVTWIDGEQLLAFDVGAGNALIDDWMARESGASFDKDGQTAARGHVDPNILSNLLDDEFFKRPPPKSLDRDAFARALSMNAPLPDGAATLTAFTVGCVTLAIEHMPRPPKRWYVCGGGAHNNVMMELLAKRLEAPVQDVGALGFDPDAIEAQAFGFMAVRRLKALPSSYPSTTAVRHPQVCGVIVEPSR